MNFNLENIPDRSHIRGIYNDLSIIHKMILDIEIKTMVPFNYPEGLTPEDKIKLEHLYEYEKMLVSKLAEAMECYKHGVN